MSKKDRIAIIVSILLLIAIYPLQEVFERFIIPMYWLIPTLIVVYWGYRFIKNDISFISIKEK